MCPDQPWGHATCHVTMEEALFVSVMSAARSPGNRAQEVKIGRGCVKFPAQFPEICKSCGKQLKRLSDYTAVVHGKLLISLYSLQSL